MHLVMSDNMRETGWSPIYCRRRFLRGFDFSTRGPSWTYLWSICCSYQGHAE